MEILYVRLNELLALIRERFPVMTNNKLTVSIDATQTVPVKTAERPAESHEVIVPSNTNGFASGECRGIYIGVGGDISVVVNGVTAVYKNTIAGTILPVKASRVNVTNTVATNLIALY